MRAHSNSTALKLAGRSALTSQVGHALRVDLELITLEMFPYQAEKHVQDAHCPGHSGGGGVSVA